MKVTFTGKSHLLISNGIVYDDLQLPEENPIAVIRRRWIVFSINQRNYTRDRLREYESLGVPYTINFEVIGEDPTINICFQNAFLIWLFIFGYFNGCNPMFLSL